MSREQRLEAAARALLDHMEFDGRDGYRTDKCGPFLADLAAALGEQEAAPHDWLAPGEAPNTSRWTCCRACGVVKREDGKPDSPCRGPAPVTLREQEATPWTDDDLRPEGLIGEQEATPPEPLLGLATTRELLRELQVRGDVSCAGGGEAGAAHLADTAADLLVTLPDALLDYRTVAAAAPQGEPEPTDDQPRVIKSWWRWNDVECPRCRRMAGWEGERCYVVDEGVICDECTTDAEKARAVPQR